MGEAQEEAGQVPAAEVTARRFRLASPATWIILLGGLASLSFVAAIPLTLLAHQLFNGLVALVIGVPAAALFNPARRRVQRLVDRRFNRARYNADKPAAVFAARLQDAVDLDAVQDELAGVVHQALEPAHVSLWINERG